MSEEFLMYVIYNLGSIFSMFLGALASSFMCWGFGRG